MPAPIPLDVDSSTVLITSVVTAIITFGFCVTHEIKAGIALVISIAVGVGLYAWGVIPIGLLLVVGFSMVVGILKAMLKSGNANSPE